MPPRPAAAARAAGAMPSLAPLSMLSLPAVPSRVSSGVMDCTAQQYGSSECRFGPKILVPTPGRDVRLAEVYLPTLLHRDCQAGRHPRRSQRLKLAAEA